MFGGARVIWIQGAADEIVAAVEALFEAPASEKPCSSDRGTADEGFELLKLADEHPLARRTYPMTWMLAMRKGL